MKILIRYRVLFANNGRQFVIYTQSPLLPLSLYSYKNNNTVACKRFNGILLLFTYFIRCPNKELNKKRTVIFRKSFINRIYFCYVSEILTAPKELGKCRSGGCRNSRRDILSGRCNVGIHKEDLVLYFRLKSIYVALIPCA